MRQNTRGTTCEHPSVNCLHAIPPTYQDRAISQPLRHHDFATESQARQTIPWYSKHAPPGHNWGELKRSRGNTRDIPGQNRDTCTRKKTKKKPDLLGVGLYF